eukprot:431325-Hanusia_phi.AAC.2
MGWQAGTKVSFNEQGQTVRICLPLFPSSSLLLTERQIKFVLCEHPHKWFVRDGDDLRYLTDSHVAGILSCWQVEVQAHPATGEEGSSGRCAGCCSWCPDKSLSLPSPCSTALRSSGRPKVGNE